MIVPFLSNSMIMIIVTIIIITLAAYCPESDSSFKIYTKQKIPDPKLCSVEERIMV